MFDPTQLLPLDLQLAEAWQTAAVELGLHVISPFELPVGNRTFQYGALVIGFGTARGLVLRAMPDEWHPEQCGAIWTEANHAEYFPANLSPALCHYNREEFVSFLNLFEWCGPAAEQPAWHVGPSRPG